MAPANNFARGLESLAFVTAAPFQNPASRISSALHRSASSRCHLKVARPSQRIGVCTFLAVPAKAPQISACQSQPAALRAQLSSLSPTSREAPDALRDVPEPVLRAVERLARQPRVTVADVASAAGVGIPAAEDSLVALASVTGAAIDVSEEGELAYRFPRNVRQVLRQRSIRAAVRMAWQKAFPLLFTAVRVGFGAFLVLSIVITFLAIAALAASSKSDSDSDRRSSRSSFGGGGGFYFGPRLFGPNIFDVMFYSRRMGGYGRASPSVGRGREEPEGMSFLESVYSFVFGDGNPNEDILGPRRWRKVAAVIRASNGAVTAEQVAPFLDLPSSYSPGDASTATNVDEGFMLAVMQRFHGHPEVTDDGDLIYVFPDLGVTGSSAGGAGSMDVVGTGSTTALREVEYTLTKATGQQKFFAGLLGAINLGGVLTLGSMLATAVPTTVDSAALLSFASAFYPALFAYALTFVLVPVSRWFWYKRENASIRGRNSARTRASIALARPDRRLRAKLQAASLRGENARVVEGDDVIFSSDRDATDQPGLERQATKDFDKRLNERSSSS